MRFFRDLPGQTAKTWDWHTFWLFCCINLIFLAGCASPIHKPATSQSRAVYICNFGEFVQWPREVYADSKTPFVIGIYGVDTLGGKLESLAKNQRINRREVVVRTVRTEEEMRRCQILFISGVKRANLPGSMGRFSEAELAGIASRLSDTAVLTVSEEVNHFSTSGIMINLTEGVEKTHFEINIPAANQAGLKVSFKLQALAWGIVR